MTFKYSCQKQNINNQQPCLSPWQRQKRLNTHDLSNRKKTTNKTVQNPQSLGQKPNEQHPHPNPLLLQEDHLEHLQQRPHAGLGQRALDPRVGLPLGPRPLLVRGRLGGARALEPPLHVLEGRQAVAQRRHVHLERVRAQVVRAVPVDPHADGAHKTEFFSGG